jgi:hypothetical protein
VARLYWEDFDAAASEELQSQADPFSAAIAVQMFRANNEAIFEESGYDQSIVLHASETCSGSWYFGPVPVPVRYDRDGLPRALKITPLCEGGTGERTLYCFYLDEFRDGDTTVDILRMINWTVAAAATCEWQTEKTITPPRSINFPSWAGLPDAPSGDATADYTTHALYGYLLFKWDSVATSPVWTGVRIREAVSV